MLVGEGADLLDLGGGDVMGIDAANTATGAMHLQHDNRSLLAIHVEEFLQYDHYEIHRRVIVIKQYDTEQ